ncbi:MAG: hotdog fold thioesterase [Planctomycetaceae bacterium]|jgi:acyl-CoA thioesterase|nr:hotdog fold thioesterase [Planctomycetaceae bacterium]
MSEICEEILNLPAIELILTKDRFALLMGVKLEALQLSYAKVSLEIEEKHLNGVDIVQGGAVFAMADFAFALASNSYGTTAVGIESSISYFKPSRSGKLFAEAVELSRSKSLGAYDVKITNEQGNPVAVFHGRCFYRP